MKNLLFIVFTLFFAAPLFSQSYMTAGGLRLGTDWGLTVNQRVLPRMTVEGIVQSSLQREEVIVTGLVKKHYPLAFRGLNFYIGGGVHKGWSTANSGNDLVLLENKDPFGITGVAGLELSLFKHLNLSYDFKPAINVVGGENKIYPQTGLSIRYVFLDDKKYQKKLKKRKKDARKEKRKDWFEDKKFWKKDD